MTADARRQAPSATHSAVLRLSMRDAEAATRAVRSLAADNAGHVTCEAQGATLVVTARGPAMLGLMRSLDDVFDGLRSAGLLR